MPAEAHDALAVEIVGVNAGVLRMNVDETRAEVANAAGDIDVLPDKMRGIEIQAERGDSFEHRRPQVRRGGEVGAAWPFVEAEKHRAIFDAEAHTGVLSAASDIGPYL